MSLEAIVAALGGEVHPGGRTAHVAAPGHSRADRSISLLLDGDRLVIHGFGAADWREVRDHLRRSGLIDRDGRLSASSREASFAGSLDRLAPRPSVRARIATAEALWRTALPLKPGDLCQRHLGSRGIPVPVMSEALRRSSEAPVSVFRQGGRTCPALIAAVCTPQGDLSAVEIAYLDPDGRAARDLRLPRKTVGVVPPGSSIRLCPAAGSMLVAEGVATTLSAMARFRLPGWALMSAGNLAAWRAPPGVRRVLIAADRGRAGEAAAARLQRRLEAASLEAAVHLPPPEFGDWNDATP